MTPRQRRIRKARIRFVVILTMFALFAFGIALGVVAETAQKQYPAPLGFTLADEYSRSVFNAADRNYYPPEEQ